MFQHHPSTLKEMVDILEHTLSSEALDDIRSLERASLVNKQFGLGLYIRNHLIHQNDSKIALYKDCHRKHPTLVGPLHSEADDVSQLVIQQLWKRLKGIQSF